MNTLSAPALNASSISLILFNPPPTETGIKTLDEGCCIKFKNFFFHKD